MEASAAISNQGKAVLTRGHLSRGQRSETESCVFGEEYSRLGEASAKVLRQGCSHTWEE